MKFNRLAFYASLSLALSLPFGSICLIKSAEAASAPISQSENPSGTRYESVTVDGVKIFYREAGSKDKPTVLLLHGFPTSSHMFRNLIPQLATKYHVVAPDYPGYGFSDMPAVQDFDYSFDNLAKIVDDFTNQLGLKKFSLYVMDYGAPIGFRIASKHPDKIEAIIVQNGNAYDEGLDNKFWEPIKKYWKDASDTSAAPLRKLFEAEATKWQYTNGVQKLDKISPDCWTLDQGLMDRPGNKEIQLALFKSYGSNPPHYPEWQEYFRKHQPPVLIEWGKNDEIFPPAGAYPYKRDLKTLDFHLLDTGHFALEEYGDQIGPDILKFLDKHVVSK